MAYYPDLSPYQYRVQKIDPLIVNIGWLDGVHPRTTGNVSEDFIERLWAHCQNYVREFRGYHECELCSEPAWPYIGKRGNEELALGSAEIRVSGKNGVVYAAPNLIYHYVIDHHYLPPEEFIQAVLESPLPDKQTE